MRRRPVGHLHLRSAGVFIWPFSIIGHSSPDSSEQGWPVTSEPPHSVGGLNRGGGNIICAVTTAVGAASVGVSTELYYCCIPPIALYSHIDAHDGALTGSGLQQRRDV